jgi:hypothetical protein
MSNSRWKTRRAAWGYPLFVERGTVAREVVRSQRRLYSRWTIRWFQIRYIDPAYLDNWIFSAEDIEPSSQFYKYRINKNNIVLAVDIDHGLPSTIHHLLMWESMLIIFPVDVLSFWRLRLSTWDKWVSQFSARALTCLLAKYRSS